MKSFTELLNDRDDALNFYLDICSDPESSQEDIVTARENLIALDDELDKIEWHHHMMSMGGEE